MKQGRAEMKTDLGLWCESCSIRIAPREEKIVVEGKTYHQRCYSKHLSMSADTSDHAGAAPQETNEYEGRKKSVLDAFTAEAADYCRGISDTAAGEYARDYARMLSSRATGAEFTLPRVPYGLPEPHRKLIRSALDTIRKKHFPR